jgi:rRNA pseudouridine-1189 N-methylase Emg1 (Nep1/Mra1 family)
MPANAAEEKFVPTSIRLHPAVLEWAKREAKKRGCGYQTVIKRGLAEESHLKRQRTQGAWYDTEGESVHGAGIH